MDSTPEVLMASLRRGQHTTLSFETVHRILRAADQYIQWFRCQQADARRREAISDLTPVRFERILDKFDILVIRKPSSTKSWIHFLSL